MWGKHRHSHNKTDDDRVMHVVQHLLSVVTLLLITTCTGAARDNPHRKSAYLQSIAKQVNSDAESTWHASKTLAGIEYQNADLLRQERDAASVLDWRTGGLLRSVDNQGTCGSCWAFASTHAFDDYRSLQAKTKQTATSVHRVTACCKYSGCNGCSGGQSESGFRFLHREGTVPDACERYSSDELCLLRNPRCPMFCADGSTKITPAFTSRYKLREYSRITPLKMKEALALGPLVAVMNVYMDFYCYKGGIYQYSKGERKGRHLIEVVGYGSQNGKDYWICKNSWGSQWGEKGFFRIAVGVEKEYGIEQIVLAPFSIAGGTTPSQESSGFLLGVNEHSETDDPTVREAAEFGAYELNPFCPGKDTDPTVVRNMTLIKVNRASRKVVSGVQITLTATYQEPECPEQTSYEFVVVMNTDGNYSLIESRYVPSENVEDTSAGSRHTENWLLILLLFGVVKILCSAGGD
ncbi:cathepsin B-like [Oscarella lobularis]|uniref:cathepsin B-like n=1 Tax=Oscarella lobularis TaxID=121494 RepID=UPI003313C0C4